MKKRYVYSLLFGIPGFFIAVILSLVIFGVTAGILWVYAFGDNPWPSSAGGILSVSFVLIFLTVWASFIAIGFVTGRRLEKDPFLNKSHVLISGGLTIVFILFIVLQQFSVGNLGPKSDSALCSDYCTLNGYPASGMPPQDSGDRTCSCYDDFGNEALKVPLNSIDPDVSE